MGTGYFLVRGDKTTCGGKIIEGADDHTIMGIPQARDMDRVTCGQISGNVYYCGRRAGNGYSRQADGGISGQPEQLPVQGAVYCVNDG